MVESQIVDLVVAGSKPVIHLKNYKMPQKCYISDLLKFLMRRHKDRRVRKIDSLLNNR